MIRLAKSLATKLLMLLMLLIVLSALFIGSMRLLTPAASYFRGEIEQWLTQQMQRPVRIGGFSAHWRGLGPEMVLNAVEVDSPEATHTTLRLAEIRVSLAIMDSLRNLAIKTRQVTLSRVKLLIRRHPNGTFTIGGLDALGDGGDDSSGLLAIPSRIRLEESDIAFEDPLISASPQLFRNVNALLRNAGERHQLEADLPFPGGGHLELKADIQGDVSRASGWNADIFIKGEGIVLASLLQPHIPEGYTMPSGKLEVELWGHWQAGRFQQAQGRGNLADLLLQREATMEASAHDLKIDRLGGDFLWTAQLDDWQLDVRHIEFERNGSAWPESGFTLSSRLNEDRQVELLAGANFARAADIAAIAQVFLSPTLEISQALEKIAPKGEVRDLRFESGEDEGESRWSLQGRYESLSTQPWKQLPGVQDLDADFWLSGDSGSLLLNSHSAVLRFPGLFRDPLELKTLQGAINWARKDDGSWRMETPNILAITKDIRTNTRLTIEIPALDDKSVFMDMQTDFSDGLAINAHRYYPVGIMPDAVVSWLDRGIVDGKVTTGSALVRGPLRDFPFHKTQNGVFEVFFHTDNTTIDYAPGWPRLTNVAAEVRFLQNGFDVWVEQGKIFDSQLKQTHGRIDDFKHSPFELKGSIEGELQNNLQLLRESPLAEDFAALTEGMKANGNAVTLIDLTIPIQEGQKFSLDGTIQFGGNSLQLQEWQLPLLNIRGNLNFTDQKIEGHGLEAAALGSDIVVDIDTVNEPLKATRITTKAIASSQQLARRFADIDFRRIRGKTAWTLRLDIPHRQADTDNALSILASSNLKGIDIALPAPFGKAAHQVRDLTLSMDFPKNGSKPLYLEYGSLVDLVLAFEADARVGYKISRGALQFGGDQARIPRQEGIEIGGRIKNLDLSAWSDLLQSQAGNESSLSLRKIKLDVERLSAGDFEFDDVGIDFRREKNFLNGELTSRQAEGSIQIPDDIPQQPLRVQLKRLSLNYDPSRVDKPQRPQPDTTDPTRLPAIELEAKKVEINGKDFGTMQLISRHVATGLELQAFSLKAKQLQLSAAGKWTRTGAGDQSSRLQLSLSTDSLGKLLDDLGYQRYIDQAPAVLDSELNWNGSPSEFSPTTLNGELKLQLGKGQFLNVDPGIGRVFGLLNFAALQRRLSLDFSDLLKKGLAFDSVGGNFELENGDAYTTNFQINGPSAQVDISGRTGLANEDFDQLVTVTPRLSAALPVAGFLAGGPVGGAAMLLAQGLIGEAFDDASKRQYEFKGPWSDPVLTPLTGNQPAQDSQAEDSVEPDQPVSNSATEKITPGFFETLKKQLTPTRRNHQEAADGRTLGGDP